MDDKRALNLALRFMSMAGQQPHVNNWYSKMNTCVLISCIVILWPIIIIKMLTNLDDVDILVLSLESMLTLYQLLIKIIFCQMNRKKFMRLLDNMEMNFWHIENYQDDKVRDEVKKVTHLFWRLNLMYIIGAFFLGAGFIFRPILSGGRQLPLICWLPEGNPSPLYEFTYIIQAYLIYSTIPVVGGFDTFFVSVNIPIVNQFKMLRYELKNIIAEDEHQTIRNLNRCVEHHTFLLACIEDIMETCSILLLNQYFLCIVTICVEMYSLTENNEPAKVLNCVMYLLMAFLESAFLCITPTMLEEENSKVATSVYLSNWQEIRSPGICNSIRFIMMKSQSLVQFTAGGLFAVNVQCLTTIGSTGVSYYTLLKNRKSI